MSKGNRRLKRAHNSVLWWPLRKRVEQQLSLVSSSFRFDHIDWTKLTNIFCENVFQFSFRNYNVWDKILIKLFKVKFVLCKMEICEEKEYLQKKNTVKNFVDWLPIFGWNSFIYIIILSTMTNLILPDFKLIRSLQDYVAHTIENRIEIPLFKRIKIEQCEFATN